ncbi:MAG TPA: dipeptidase [Acidimicrobiales bacterium]|nr:dipeptidase [Acidimicrobiales bacterium]
MQPPRLTAYVDAERDRILATLADWLRIPSISADPAHAADVVTSAEFCAGLLREAGLENVAVLPTPGAPSVYGEWLHAPGAPTALVYGHHDVQPVDPLELWESPPFEPVFVDGECRARGAVDDKGQTLYEIEAVRALLAADGALPVNVKFLVEGEEEVGSPNFERLLQDNAAKFACDVVVVSDTTMVARDVPSVCVGMRGLVAFDVALRTAEADLHSGVFGGAAPNAAHLAARLAASLHDADGRVTIPGFYDDVLPLSPREQSSVASLPGDDASWMAMAGIRRTEGEAGYGIHEQVGYRPTAEVTGISSGYAGPGIKTIVPATATLKLSFRLVAAQDPSAIAKSVEQWITDRVPEGVDVVITPVGGVGPIRTPVDHPGMRALSRAVEIVWGQAPLLTREGGSGPEEALARVLDAPCLFLGVGLPDDRFHAPNERLVLEQFWRGLLAAGELWPALAEELGTDA